MQNASAKAIDWSEQGLVPDSIIRHSIKHLLPLGRVDAREPNLVLVISGVEDDDRVAVGDADDAALEVQEHPLPA